MTALVSMSMDPVDKDLRLDDGDEAVLLADEGVASQAMYGLINGVVNEGVVCHINVKNRAPLCELGPAGVVGDAIIVEATEDVAPGCALVSPYKGLEAEVDINTGDNACRLKQVREEGTVCSVLVEPLLKQALLV